MSDGIEPKTTMTDPGVVEKGPVPVAHDATVMSKNLEAK